MYIIRCLISNFVFSQNLYWGVQPKLYQSFKEASQDLMRHALKDSGKIEKVEKYV